MSLRVDTGTHRTRVQPLDVAMIALGWFSVIVLYGLAIGQTAGAQPAPAVPHASVPLLRIEAGHHTGAVQRLSVDSQNRYLATVSKDKTVRIWELPKFELQTVLRPPIGNGIKGTLYAVAISPDGTMVSCGGVEGEVYVFQRESKLMLHRLKDFPNIITHLAYSPDGRWLVVTLGGQQGIRLFDARTYDQIAQDTAYGATSHYAEFSGDGRLITVSDDGLVRLYEIESTNPAALKLVTKAKLQGERPRSASFSPDGRTLVVGFTDRPRVDLLSTKDLSIVATLDVTGADADQHFVSTVWADGGKSIYGAGSYQARGKTLHKRGATLIRRWTTDGARTFQDFPVAEGSIEQLVSLKTGEVVFGSHDPAIGSIDSTGTRTHFLESPIADFRGMGDEFKISEDGTVVRFAYHRGESFIKFTLESRSLSGMLEGVLELGPIGLSSIINILLYSPDHGETGLLPLPFTRDKTVKVEDWKDHPSPKLNGTAIALKPGELSRSMAVTPDREHVLFGTESRLRYFDRDGTARWQVSVPGIVWNLNIAKNGLVAVAALGDGTIRWYRLQDGQELAAFYPHPNRRQWVVWTPKGYYDAESGAEELIGWHVNHPGVKAAEFYDASRLFEQFYHPELVSRVFKTWEPDTVVLQALGQKEQINLTTGIKPTPTVTMTSSALMEANRDEIDVIVKAEDQGGGIGEIRLYHNEKLVETTTRGIALITDVTAGKIATVTYHLRLIPGDNWLRAIALNTDRTESAPAELHIPFKGAEKQSVLHLMVVGINQYKNPDLNLNFAEPDALAISKFFAPTPSKLFRSVKVTQVMNKTATKSEVIAKLQTLKHTAPEDVAIIYLAGHGVSADPHWYFLPHDVEYPEKQVELQNKGISAQELFELVRLTQARKVLLILDACKSGFAAHTFAARGSEERRALVQLAHATGIHLMAASTKDQVASEIKELGHGVFTYTLLKGLSGAADGGGKDGFVTVLELQAFLEAQLPILSEKYKAQPQYPVSKLDGMDFPLVAIR